MTEQEQFLKRMSENYIQSDTALLFRALNEAFQRPDFMAGILDYACRGIGEAFEVEPETVMERLRRASEAIARHGMQVFPQLVAAHAPPDGP